MTHPQDVVEQHSMPRIPTINGVLNIMNCRLDRCDENYVPYEHSGYPALPPKVRARTMDYLEVLDETPLLTVVQMLVMQCAWWVYLSCNIMGSKQYSKGTNHFSPYSPIFRVDQWLSIFLSDIGLLGMGYGLYSAALIYGWKAIFMYYFVPYMLCNHWYVCSAPLPI
ncbi:hypothetical protein C8Q72DRAFT_890356 [Fomitopsis betulina]|nr:hypothetical protein C8Q72DRAFT_890356 [Fomitopsis betulina]